MELIEQLRANEFVDYLKKYGNTICGRHPIAVMLFVSTQISIFYPLKQGPTGEGGRWGGGHRAPSNVRYLT
jgi:hypothetical protein